jgi:hypothetical protein
LRSVLICSLIRLWIDVFSILQAVCEMV